jgi:tripartite ATP-independent transporter DctP family solute receptor
MKKIILMVIIVSLLTSCAQQPINVKKDYVTTFRLAESHPEEHPTTIADYYFAQLVDKKSQGRIKVIIYSNKSLGEEKSIIEQIQFGAIDFARVSVGPLTEFVPELNVIQLPYLYNDSEHMWRVLGSDIGEYFLSSVEAEGFSGLTWLDAGARNFYSSIGPIKSIEDLKGLKIRTMESSMMIDMIDALGAKAIGLPYGEVYGDLQIGKIDAAENNWPSYDASEHYEVAKYYSIDEHIRVPEMLIASKMVFDKLSEADKALIKSAAIETQAYQRILWEAEEQESEKKLQGEGVITNIIEDRSAFKEAMAPIYKKYAAGYEDVIEQINAMVE